VIAFKSNGKSMECWDFKSQSLKYEITDWYKSEPGCYIKLGPYNSSEQILLAQVGDYIYEFDLLNGKIAYYINLKNEENKDSSFQLLG
jgi:hypothetical protein